VPHAFARAAVMALFVVAGAATEPRAVAGRAAGPFFDGDPAAAEALAHEVAASSTGAVGVSAASFHTGSARFDGEWALVTDQMAVLGLGQVVLAHPELAERYLPVLDACADRLLAPPATAFGASAWGHAALDDLASDRGHAYLGYLDLALGMIRRISPGTRFAAVHDRITAAIVRRLAAAPHAIVETYPGEAYPADVASLVGAIGASDRATAADHGALLHHFADVFRARWVDPASGLLYQSGDARRGVPTGAPRASGTALAAYFLSFADPALSRDLFAAVARSQRASFLGFGGVREYAPGASGDGDVDSGPVLFGVSVSATGFALAGARASGDRAFFTELYRTADLFGVPVDRGDGRRFATGGPLGNALLLAMLTAERWP
jgi:hypothetical protein